MTLELWKGTKAPTTLMRNDFCNMAHEMEGDFYKKTELASTKQKAQFGLVFHFTVLASSASEIDGTGLFILKKKFACFPLA